MSRASNASSNKPHPFRLHISFSPCLNTHMPFHDGPKKNRFNGAIFSGVPKGQAANQNVLGYMVLVHHISAYIDPQWVPMYYMFLIWSNRLDHHLVLIICVCVCVWAHFCGTISFCYPISTKWDPVLNCPAALAEVCENRIHTCTTPLWLTLKAHHLWYTPYCPEK